MRAAGGGRKKIVDIYPTIKDLIDDLIEPDTRGDPESPLRWTCKSTKNISDAMHANGFSVSPRTIASILDDADYSLQGNKKTKEVKQYFFDHKAK